MPHTHLEKIRFMLNSLYISVRMFLSRVAKQLRVRVPLKRSENMYVQDFLYYILATTTLRSTFNYFFSVSAAPINHGVGPN